MNTVKDLALIIKSHFPVVSVETNEERRMLEVIEKACAQENWPCFTWTIANGIRRLGRVSAVPGTQEFQQAPPDRARIREPIAEQAKVCGIDARGVKGKLDASQIDMERIAAASEGFSGAAIEQAIVAAIYEARAEGKPFGTEMVLSEIERTRPLSVVMAERVEALRQWAASRTVSAD